MTRLVSFVFALELVAGVYASPSFSLFKRATSSSSSTTTSDTCARVDGQLSVTKSNGKSYTAGSIRTYQSSPLFGTDNLLSYDRHDL